MPQPIRYDSQFLDLTKRFQVYTTVDASPSGATETVIATLNLVGFADTAIQSGIWVTGFARWTDVATTTAIRLRIRQTDINGTVVADTGAVTAGVSSTSVMVQDVEGFDSGAGAAKYALTITLTGAGGATTISALLLRAILI